MKLIDPSQYAAAAHALYELRHLRRVKVYPTVHAVTIVTYYKATERKQCDYNGTAYTFDWFNLHTSAVPVAHSRQVTAQSEEEETEAEVESEPQPSRAIGCSTISSPYYQLANLVKVKL